MTNAGWVDGNATDGFRKCLGEEFSKIYVFHLRGNQRTSGELSRREGGKIFGAGSRAPIAITILVKDKNATKQGQILFHDIGDYLDQNQKLAIINNFKSISGIQNMNKFSNLKPDEDNDWVNQGSKDFKKLWSIGDKNDANADVIFNNYGAGLKTGRDAWCYNFSSVNIDKTLSQMVNLYNDELRRVKEVDSTPQTAFSLNRDPKRINWNRGLLNDFERRRAHKFNPDRVYSSLYRPFTKSHVCFDRPLNDMVYQNYRFFPRRDTRNKIICVTGVGGTEFSCLATNVLPCLDLMARSQCFPLFTFDPSAENNDLLSYKEANHVNGENPKTNIEIRYFTEQYNREVSPNQVFHYVYGLLHSEEYRSRFKNNLTKELPRIPVVKEYPNFLQISDFGKKLSDLHINFEDAEIHACQFKEGDLKFANTSDPISFFRVEKMKFAKKGDLSSVIYNKNLTIQNIPIEAWDYVVNGKPALQWVMERQCVKTDKASGIVNDANDYANDTMNNPAYPLELFQRVITVSLETMKIVRGLPELDID